MPLILLTGLPSSGKTHRAHQLYDAFQRHLSVLPNPPDLQLISVHSLDVSRTVYATPSLEKNARALQYSAVKRVLSKEAIIIVDAPNYIKGFRYQLYCEARNVETPSCVVHAAASIETCRDNNNRLLAIAEDVSAAENTASEETGPYPAEIFEELVMRYEEPNGMTRWDSPLFTVLHSDSSPPFDAIRDALYAADGKSKSVKPNQATVMKAPAASTHLYMLDKCTTELVKLILAFQREHIDDGADGGGVVKIKDVEEMVELPVGAGVSMAMLQRMRRGFIAMERLPMMAVGMGELGKGKSNERDVGDAAVKRRFVAYLNTQFQAP